MTTLAKNLEGDKSPDSVIVRQCGHSIGLTHVVHYHSRSSRGPRVVVMFFFFGATARKAGGWWLQSHCPWRGRLVAMWMHEKKKCCDNQSKALEGHPQSDDLPPVGIPLWSCKNSSKEKWCHCNTIKHDDLVLPCAPRMLIPSMPSEELSVEFGHVATLQ